jgi:tripartite-type tricarboxylate transporter receptor subunit TctC
MKKAKYFILGILVLSSVTILLSHETLAQVQYPTQTISLVVGYQPGGPTDVIARVLAQEAKKYLRQEIQVVNKPGGGATIGVGVVINSKPDGYTLGCSPTPPFILIPHLQDLPYDALRDTTPILSIGTFRIAAAVKSDSPFKTFKDFIEYAKNNPSKASYGHPGPGTRPDIVMQMIAHQENIKLNYVPFHGDSPALTALLGGHVMAAGMNSGTFIPHVKAGDLRFLVILEDDRLEEFPNVPSIKDLGYDYALPLILLIYGPKNLQENIISKIEEAFDKATRSPSFIRVAREHELHVKRNMFHKELMEYLIREKARTGEIIKKVGLGKKG